MKKPGVVEFRGVFFIRVAEINKVECFNVERPERSVLRTTVAKGSTMRLVGADGCPGCLYGQKNERVVFL